MEEEDGARFMDPKFEHGAKLEVKLETLELGPTPRGIVCSDLVSLGRLCTIYTVQYILDSLLTFIYFASLIGSQ